MSAINNIFSKFPVIQTQQLILRKLVISDIDELYELYNAEETQRYQTRYNYSRQSLINYILSQEEAFSNKEKIMWAIERVSDRAFIGVRIIYCDDPSGFIEVQGDTKKKFWRHGLTKEAYIGILSFLQQHKINGAYVKIQQQNINAIKLVESLNFTPINSFVSENGLPFIQYAIRLN